MTGFGFAACDDFLDDHRYPYTSQTNSPEFWNNPTNCDQECNRLYNTFSGYGNGASPNGDFYFKPLNDDNANESFMNWPYINIPTSASEWKTPYEWIRHCALIIQGVRSSSLTESQRKNYEGIARLNRALQTFELVKKFGDCVWVSEPVTTTDPLLYAARTDRDIVMDSILNDLDYAIAAISAQSAKQEWSKDMALAVKSEICLFEGTYCKYRTLEDNVKAPDDARSKKYLEECVKASEPLMNSYTLNPGFTDVYTNVRTGIASDTEWIFGKAYEKNVLMNALIGYLTGTTPINGMSKDAFESYLFIDGKPMGATTEDTTDKGVWTGDALDITNLLAVRDGRLAQIIDPYVYYAGNGDANLTYNRGTANNMTATTGYGIRKYDDLSLPVSAREEAGQNYTCAPIYYLSEILCNYAEAKAELGTMSDTDFDKTINALWKRANSSNLTKAGISHDPKNTAGVSDLVWEARRARRCELIMDRGFRYWDLIRWHQLDKLDSKKNPDIKLGANWSPATITPNYAIGDYVNGYKGSDRTFDKKYYFYPIPSGQIALNPNLSQNPGWK